MITFAAGNLDEFIKDRGGVTDAMTWCSILVEVLVDNQDTLNRQDFASLVGIGALLFKLGLKETGLDRVQSPSHGFSGSA